MDRQDAVRLQVAEVDRECFLREQMNGNGVSGEGIDGQQIEILAGFAFQRKPAVADNNFDLGAGIPQKGELGLRDPYDQVIDLVKAIIVAWFAVNRQSAGAEA